MDSTIEVNNKPLIGALKVEDYIDTKKGKMVFVSSSKPFEGEQGKMLRQTCVLINKGRQAKKRALCELGMSGKRFRALQRSIRRNKVTDKGLNVLAAI